MVPTPEWARCHVEIYEAPGFLDDCFRSNLWTKFQSAASESFLNANDVAGDYAIMTVTEGATPTGCGYRKDISSENMSTDTYPRLRVRLRGRGTTPHYKIGVEYTDASANETGWTSAPSEMTVDVLELLSGKTIKYVMLYAKCAMALGTAYIDWDYAVIGKNPPLVPTEHREVEVDLCTTIKVSGLRLKLLDDVLLGVTDRRYSLDEGEGGHAYDLSRKMGHAELTNTSWGTGKHGGCIYFNGTSARMETGYNPVVLADGELTISFWLKAPPGASGVICGCSDAVGADWNRIQFNFTGNQLRLYVKDDAGNIRQYTTQSVVCTNEWVLVTGVISPADDKIEVWVGDYYDGGASGALGAITIDDNDLTWGCLHNQGSFTNYAEGYVDEAMVLTRALVEEEIYGLTIREPPSGAARACAGNIVMVYMGAHNESLVTKLITARVIDRLTSGDPNEPTVELVCEDLGEILFERTFTEEYANPTQISNIVGDIVDQVGAGLFVQVDGTNRTIVNEFRDEGVWSLLQKLAETAKFGTGETGANVYVDPGGALRFKMYGAWTSVLKVSDGSDGSSPNILDIRARETMKGEPRLVNDAKVIIFEDEYHPKDQDSWTEAADSWSSPDPTDMGYPQSDTGDKKSGTASIKFQTTNP
ncbi:MAG: LamG domain-containing protein, partial [Candidatus Bathyarchaeota archaeon]|nr:LamG domain-containing protein [Candidatus Bathyarchaeota archaeon]